VDSITGQASNFSTLNLKKITTAPIVRVIVTCCVHRQGKGGTMDNGVDYPLTSPEYIEEEESLCKELVILTQSLVNDS